MLGHTSHAIIVFRFLKKGRSKFWPIVFWIATGVWFLVLWKLSSTSGSSLPSLHFPHADKVAHFTYFFIGGTLLTNAFRLTFRWRLPIVFLAVLLVIGSIGIVDEWHQTSTPGRSGNDRGDLLADCLGGGLAALFITSWYGRKKS